MQITNTNHHTRHIWHKTKIDHTKSQCAHQIIGNEITDKLANEEATKDQEPSNPHTYIWHTQFHIRSATHDGSI